MSYLPLRREPTLQPSIPLVSPVWAEKGLTHYFLDGKYYSVGGPLTPTPLAVNGAPTRKPGKHGPCAGFGTVWGSGATDAYLGAVLPPPTTRRRSLFAAGYAQTLSGVLFVDRSVTQLSSKEAVWWSTGGVTTLYYLTQTTTGGIAQHGPGDLSIPGNSWWTWGMSLDRSALNVPTFFVNGEKRSTETPFGGSGAYLDGVTDMMIGNRWEGYDRPLNGLLGVLLFFDGFLSDADHRALHANPWRVFAPTTSFLPLPVDTTLYPPQLLAPASDLNAGLWLPSAGGILSGMLDEAAASDDDFIVAASPTDCELRLAVGGAPSVRGDCIVRYRLLAGQGTVSVQLRQGSAILAAWGPHALTGDPQDFAQTLSVAQVAAITDYADLRLYFRAE